MKITGKTTTKQTLSPGVIQLTELIQMNCHELEQYLLEQAMENPAIDIDSLYSSPLRAELFEKVQWLNSFGRAPEPGGPDDERADAPEPAAAAPTVRSHLLQQLTLLDLEKGDEDICRYLIGCVDGHGFLNEDWAAAAERLGVPAGRVEDCARLLRGLSPPGICSAGIRECLIAQLDEDEDGDGLIKSIISGCLEELSRGHYTAIAKELSVPVSRVRRAEERIKRLCPYPSAAFDGSARNCSVVPDICIEQCGGRLRVWLPHSCTPYLKISSYCRELRSSAGDPEVLRYLDECILSASRLFANVSRSESTLLLCAEKVAELQREYFQFRSAPLVPMTLADVADETGLSVSTVSRALRGRYIQCIRGTVPARALFSRRLESETELCSADRAKLLIRDIVDTEDKRDPVSDARLSEILSGKGVRISRRTAAKYREELGIPSSFVRRQENG